MSDRREIVASQPALQQLCDHLAKAKLIAFDTEFVSEHTYRSELCLVQVATVDEAAIIDAVALPDLKAFWEVLAKEGHETIVHAGREELLFSLAAIGRGPANLFDVQLAAGFCGYEFPAGYGTLINRILGLVPRKGETRTDWRRRPLSDQQIDYALEDVRHLIPLRNALHQRLNELGRLDWMTTDMREWQNDIEESLRRERWQRISGISGLSRRSLAIVRELWKWREAEAQRRDWPPRRVLRDDLIIEMAKRRSSDPKQIRAVRGMERGDFQRYIPAWSQAVERALNLPNDDCPYLERREVPARLNMLGQFLQSALTSICHQNCLAPNLVGTASDVRDLVAYRLGYGDDEPPHLARGWRAEVVGELIGDLLAGRKSIRIKDPQSEEPFVFDPSD